MPVRFSGWKVIDDGASLPPVELRFDQLPNQRRIYIMYHGTSVANARLIIPGGFKQSTGGMLGPGVYVTRDIKKASIYPKNCPMSDRVILELRVRPGRVKRIDNDNDLQFPWHDKGYNTAWVPPKCDMKAVPAGFEEDCVFNPGRVKVVGIAKAPDSSVQSELEQLLDAAAAAAGRAECSVCNRKTQRGAQHAEQPCWECGKTICILAAKHFCVV